MIRTAALLLLAAAAAARADGEARPLEDNSFLLEEAYNQEPGVVQTLTRFERARESGDWLLTLSQEWPVPDERHQLSVDVAYGRAGGERGVADTILAYRYQAFDDERVAAAPRIAAILPTGDADRDLGAGGVGGELTLPVSAKLGRWVVFHANLGAAWVPEGKRDGARASLRTYTLGESLIFLPHPRVNLLVEVLWEVEEAEARGVTVREDRLVVSPGLRAGVDLPGELQLVAGVAVPLGIGPSAGDVAVLGYLSAELPLWRPAAGRAD